MVHCGISLDLVSYLISQKPAQMIDLSIFFQVSTWDVILWVADKYLLHREQQEKKVSLRFSMDPESC